MINTLAITNNVVIQKAPEVEQKNEIQAQWKGKKIYVANNPRSGWIARIASAILIALGIILIAAVSTIGTITFGIALIGFTSLFLILHEKFRAKAVHTEEKNRREGLLSFSRFFRCREDYSDLYEVEWEQDKNTVTIHLPEKKFNKRPDIIFIPECGDPKHHPFILTLYLKGDDNPDPRVFVYDQKLKKKLFKINFYGQSILCEDCPKRPSELRAKFIQDVL